MAKALLTYSDQADQKIYLKTTLMVAGKPIKLEAVTVAGSADKPNEDSFAGAFDGKQLLLGVFDGSTSLKPIDGLAGQTGARFASHFLKRYLPKVDNDLTPRSLLLQLNALLLDHNLQFEGTTLADTHTLPSSLATIIKIDLAPNKLLCAHVGDSYGIVFYADGSSQLFTDDKVQPFDEAVKVLIRRIAQEKGVTNRVAREDKRVRQAFIDMYQERNNHASGHGSGFVNGDPNIELYIHTSAVNLKKAKAILLATDGFTPQGWSIENERDRQKLFAALGDGGVQKLITIKQGSEDNDPDWDHIRFKHSDDATGVLITL